MNVIMLNGPPGCGKDTAAGLVQEIIPGAMHCKFSSMVKERAHRLYGLELPSDHFEGAAKDVGDARFLGATPRIVYIEIIRWLKSMHGQDILGRMLWPRLQWIRDSNETQLIRATVVVSDLGFEDEGEYIASRAGRKNCRIIQIVRDGCTYSGDSRGEVDGTKFGVVTDQIYNNGTVADLRRVLTGLLT